MRSYTYGEGKWVVCKDTFPATASSPGIYSSETERSAWATFKDALDRAGFQASSSSQYVCRFGALTVYARNHAMLTQQRKQAEMSDFLCVLHLGGTAIRVWIDALPNLFLFFSDIDARREDETLKDFLTDETFRRLLSNLSGLADQMWEGLTHITVEIEPPEKR